MSPRETTVRPLQRVRGAAGSLLFDKPFLAWPLWRPTGQDGVVDWARFHNRSERLLAGPDGRGWDCDWPWTSDLTIGAVFPRAARGLLRAALRDWPVRPASPPPGDGGDSPDITFVIGHRGRARVAALLATLASLSGQEGCASEIVVVEQGSELVLEDVLPSRIRLVRQPTRDSATPFSRSWAFNRGALEARGRLLVFHDGDVLAPAGYGLELMRLVERGFEAMRLQRFVFYLDKASTERFVRDGSAGPDGLGTLQPELVRQNCQGHTMAIAREAYYRIGGHDEGFLGWGGEDVEFYDRCRLLRSYPWGYLPFVHLWHPPQPGKFEPGPALEYFEKVMRLRREERARKLAGRPFGSPDGPREPLET